jgi:general secretion pathway protein A
MKTTTTLSEAEPRSDLRTHFSLESLPFTREVATRNLWRSSIFEEPMRELLETVQQRMSATVIAPAGSGKTSLLRDLVDRLPEARYRTHYVKVTSLSKRDFCREIASAVGIPPAGSYPMLVRRLDERFNATLSVDGLRPVLIIDEAHDMRPDVLAILRVLTNFEMDSKLVLSLILAGQPPLAKLLRRDELEAVTQRMAHVATLRLLSREETRDYIAHRLHTAGAKTLPFDDNAMEAVYELTRGNLRAIDRLALKAMSLAAHKGVPTVDSSLVTTARKKITP